MPDGSIQLPPNSTGTKLRVYGPLTDGAYIEAVALTDANGDQFPEAPVTSPLSQASLAAGASVNLDATLITTAKTGRLIAVTASSSVPIKVVLSVQTAGTLIDTFFTSDLEPAGRWDTPHPNFIRQAGGSGARFRVTITNNDINRTADVYTTVYFDEVS